jgi:septum formation protein
MHRPGFTLVLASSSPQRKRLLAEAEYVFEAIEPGALAECGICSRETPGEMVARLARQKAADVAGQLRLRRETEPGKIVVGCDTVAECRGQILGKPADREDARRMLETLRGQVHRVYSGLCLWEVSSGKVRVRVARTTLEMDRLEDAQIDEYLASGQWQGKAGAFGWQDRPGWLRIVEGSESNVVGLPLELLGEMLAEWEEAEEAED